MGATRFAAAAALAAVLARCAPAAAQMTMEGRVDRFAFDLFEFDDCTGRVVSTYVLATESDDLQACRGPYIAAELTAPVLHVWRAWVGPRCMVHNGMCAC